jgi:hypothetical protein
VKNTRFERHGHQVTTHAWRSGERWRWSYRIDDREPVNLAESGSRSERQAFHEARHEAIAAITAMHADNVPWRTDMSQGSRHASR